MYICIYLDEEILVYLQLIKIIQQREKIEFYMGMTIKLVELCLLEKIGKGISSKVQTLAFIEDRPIIHKNRMELEKKRKLVNHQVGSNYREYRIDLKEWQIQTLRNSSRNLCFRSLQKLIPYIGIEVLEGVSEFLVQVTGICHTADLG